jgi:SnoaL-like protein
MSDPSNLSPEPVLRALVDREEIRDLVVRYCRGVDRGDWDMVRSCYHEDAFDEHGTFTGSPDDFVAHARESLPRRFERTMHFAGQSLIDFDGDVAHVETYAIGYHRWTPPDGREPRDMTVGARLYDRVERRDGHWRIAHRKLVYDWTRIDPVADEYLPEGVLVGARGPDDPSWTHPTA